MNFIVIYVFRDVGSTLLSTDCEENMIKYENECCDCTVPAYPCIGDLCKNRNVPHIYCNVCGDEMSEDDSGYDLDIDYHVCGKCLEEDDE